MNFSKKYNREFVYVNESGEADENKTSAKTTSAFKKKLASLFAYLEKNLKLKERPSVTLTKSKKNADDDFGLTGYYDHKKKSITIYITGRHDTDILRTFAHEIIHHWQNERGTLTDHSGGSEHYAQNDPNLRKREMEAYLLGSLLFRDFQDEQRYGKPSVTPVITAPYD